MKRYLRRLLIIALVGAGLALPGVITGPAVAAKITATATAVDGLHLDYLPAGLGTSSDFRYEFDDVAFVSRVWESPSPAGGWRVDLKVDVMRGAQLTDAQSLHDWFIAYEQRPPAETHYHRYSVNGKPGWRGRDQVFWLVRPGLAVSVQLDRTRWSGHELARIAYSARGPIT